MEALTIAREYAASHFGTNTVATSTRVADGCWDYEGTVGTAVETLNEFHARVRSHDGFIAQISAVHPLPHDFTESERAQLGTLADLTSLVRT